MKMADEFLTPHGVKQEECVSAAVDLWSSVLTNTTVNSVYWQVYNPEVPLESSSNNIQFRLTPTDEWTSLSESYAKVTVKIHSNATNGVLPAFITGDPATQNSVAFINNIGHSLWSQINFRINEELLSDSYATYSYLAYLVNLLSFNSDAMKTRLQIQGWELDSDITAAIDVAAAADTAAKRRGVKTALSHELTLIFPIIHPLWCQQKWIPPLTAMSLEFLKNSNAFALQTNQAGDTHTFTYKICKMQMFMKKIRLKASEKVRLENMLSKSPAKYPIRLTMVKPFFIDK